MNDLAACGIFERDEHGGVLLSWSYPILEEEEEAVIAGRSAISGGSIADAFVFHKHRNTWHYSLCAEAPAAVLPGVTMFCLSLSSRTFNPEKFQALLAVLSAQYAATGDPLSVLEVYLSVFTTGRFANDRGSFNCVDFPDQQALIAGYSLKEAILGFGLESVLLWNALVLRKRVVVYSDSVADVQSLLRVLPQLVWHRQDWGVLRPLVNMTEVELADLATSGVYCAGCTDPAVRGREDLYDVFVDAGERVITVSDASRADFAMGQLHKDVAMSMMTAAEQGTPQQVIKAVKDKTVEVINKLRQLCVAHPTTGKPVLQAQSLSGQGLPRTLERFLYNFALAEGLADDSA